MANELNLPLDPSRTGLTVTAVLILNNAAVGSPISCPESGTLPGHYSGDMPAVAAGVYGVLFLSAGSQVGTGVIDWDGAKERGLGDLPTVAQVEARTLPSADYFNPATDAVATVTSITNAVTLPSIPANWITAAGLAADAVTEIQSGLATDADVTAILEDTGTTLPGLIGDVPTVAEFNARTLPSDDYFVVSDYTAPPTPATIWGYSGRTLDGTQATQLANLDAAISTRSVFNAATDAVIVGTNNDKTGYALTQAFPSNFASLGINASGHVSRVTLVDTTTTNTDMRGTDGSLLSTDLRLNTLDAAISSRSTYDGSDTPGTVTLVSRLTSSRAGYLDKLNVTGTLANSDDAATYKADVSGLLTAAAYTPAPTTAAIWNYEGRSLDGAQAATLVTIEGAALAVADGRFAIDYLNSTATQYNDDGTTRTVFDLYDADGNLATTPESAVDRRPI